MFVIMGCMKFALVSFTKSNSVAIVETKSVSTDRDRNSMNNIDWDASVEIQVTWTHNVKGNKSKTYKRHHAATVLRFSGTLCYLFCLSLKLSATVSSANWW